MAQKETLEKTLRKNYSYLELFCCLISRIWTEYWKMRTKITPNTVTFYAVRNYWISKIGSMGSFEINPVNKKNATFQKKMYSMSFYGKSHFFVKLINHTPIWVFSRKFVAYFRNTFSLEHLWTAASGRTMLHDIWCRALSSHCTL